MKHVKLFADKTSAIGLNVVTPSVCTIHSIDNILIIPTSIGSSTTLILSIIYPDFISYNGAETLIYTYYTDILITQNGNTVTLSYNTVAGDINGTIIWNDGTSDIEGTTYTISADTVFTVTYTSTNSGDTTIYTYNATYVIVTYYEDVHIFRTQNSLLVSFTEIEEDTAGTIYWKINGGASQTLTNGMSYTTSSTDGDLTVEIWYTDNENGHIHNETFTFEDNETLEINYIYTVIGDTLNSYSEYCNTDVFKLTDYDIIIDGVHYYRYKHYGIISAEGTSFTNVAGTSYSGTERDYDILLDDTEYSYIHFVSRESPITTSEYLNVCSDDNTSTPLELYGEKTRQIVYESSYPLSIMLS